MSERPPFPAAATPSAGSTASNPAPTAASAGLSRMAGSASASAGASSLLHPKVLLERAKAVTPAAWAVASMVGFVVVTIGYTQWDYNRTTLRTQQATASAKEQIRAQRKADIRAQIEREATDNAATAARR